MASIIGKIILNIIIVIIKLWEILFGWIYTIYSNPAQVRKDYARVRSRPTNTIKDGDTSVIYKPNDLGNPEFIQDFKESIKLIYLLASCSHFISF